MLFRSQTAVTVTLSNGQTIVIEAGKSAGSVVFETPANDVYNNGSTVNTTITNATGGNFENLVTDPKAAETAITDSIDTTTVTLSTTDTAINEGGQITYTATCSAKCCATTGGCSATRCTTMRSTGRRYAAPGPLAAMPRLHPGATNSGT